MTWPVWALRVLRRVEEQTQHIAGESGAATVRALRRSASDISARRRSAFSTDASTRETVSLSALQAAFAKAFDGQTLDLDRRVVFIHGIPAASTLKPSVASLGPIPARVTLPIACGKITRAK